MVSYSHGVYIDESGLGDQYLDSVTSLWVSAAVAIPFEHDAVVEAGVDLIRATHFRRPFEELKGKGTPSSLRRGHTLDQVSQDVVDLLGQVEASAWVSATHRSTNPMPDRSRNVLLQRPQDIARKLLLERMNLHLGNRDHDAGSWMMIWDVSGAPELAEFSHTVKEFQDGYTGARRHERMASAVLGGASHQWPGLQLADWISHMGLHYAGHPTPGTFALWRRQDARQDKASTFRNVLWPALDSTGRGNREGAGFRRW